MEGGQTVVSHQQTVCLCLLNRSSFQYMDGVYTDKSKGLASTSSGSHWYVFTEKTWHTTSKVAVHLNFSWKSHFVTPYCLKVGSVGVVTDPESNVEIGNPSVTFSSNK